MFFAILALFFSANREIVEKFKNDQYRLYCPSITYHDRHIISDRNRVHGHKPKKKKTHTMIIKPIYISSFHSESERKSSSSNGDWNWLQSFKNGISVEYGIKCV